MSTTVAGTKRHLNINADEFAGELNGTVNTATTAATQSAGDNSTKVATTAFVSTAVSNLVDSSPAALNTLNELAAAINDDANFSTTITNSIATKLPLAGGTMSGAIDFNGTSGDHGEFEWTSGDGTTGDVWSLGFYQNSAFKASMEFFATSEAAADGNIRFKSGNTTTLTLDSSQNATFAGDVIAGGKVRINATTTTGLEIASSSGATSGLKLFNNSSTDAASIINHYNGDLLIGTNNATVLTMNGTTSTFAGDVSVGDDLNIAGDQLTFTNDAASAYIRGADSLIIESDFDNDDSGSKPIYFYTNGTEMARMEATVATFAGEVEATTLDINGQANIGGDIILDAGGNSTSAGIGNSGNYLHFQAKSGDTSKPQFWMGNHSDTGVYTNASQHYWRQIDSTNIATLSAGQFTVTGEIEATSLDINGNADISGVLSMAPSSGIPINITGTNSSYTAIAVKNTGTGNAGVYFDAINGDLSGSDYGFVGQNNSGYMEYHIGGSSPQAYHDFDAQVKVAGELEATSLDINGDGDVSGTLTIGTISATNYGLASADIPNNAANTTGTAASSAKLTDGGTLTTQPGTNNLIYTGQVSAGTSGLFATLDNSNSIITLNRHSGNYDSQLGFSSNGNIYYRKFSAAAINTTQAWKVLAFTDNANMLNSNVTLSSLGAAASSHTHTFASLTSKPTTISGYGITDAFDGAYGSLSGTPTIPSGNQIIDWTAENAGTIHTSNFADANTNYYLDGITKSGNALIFSVNGTTNQTYTFGSNAFNSTTIPSGNAVIDWTQANAGTIHTSNYIENVDYELPTAAANTLGGIKVGTNLSISASGVLSATDTNTTYSVGDGGLSQKNFTTALNTKLSGIADNATANSSDATLKARSNHTGTQTASTISDFDTEVANNSAVAANTAKVSNIVQTSVTGNAGTVTNGVYTTGDQSIAGNKTFSGNTSFSGPISQSNTSQSTSNSTGALKTLGGVGIAKTLNVGEDVVAYASSDKRYKNNLQAITNPIDKVKSLTGYTFTWNDKHEQFNGNNDIGVVAQEVERVFPEIVNTRDNGYKAVKYEKMVALLIEAVKDQQKQIDELKEKLNGNS